MSVDTRVSSVQTFMDKISAVAVDVTEKNRPNQLLTLIKTKLWATPSSRTQKTFSTQCSNLYSWETLKKYLISTVVVETQLKRIKIIIKYLGLVA